jgi:hypothetical protein
MSSANDWDYMMFRLAGMDSAYIQSDPLAAEGELQVARSLGWLISLLLAFNFLCTTFAVSEIFFELRDYFPDFVFYVLFVIPIGVLWTFVLLVLVRFSLMVGHLGHESVVGKIQKLLAVFPIVITLGLLGFIASVPLQVKSLSHDLRYAQMIRHWDSLGESVLTIDLDFIALGSPDAHGCLKKFLDPKVFVDSVESIHQLSECREIYTSTLSSENTRLTYSRVIDSAIRSQLFKDGLISKSALGWQEAPALSMCITFLVAFLYVTPLLLRMFSSKRAMEYWQDDYHRFCLAREANIDADAHIVFDAKGKMKTIHRFYDVEKLQSVVKDAFGQQREIVENKIKKAHFDHNESLKIDKNFVVSDGGVGT